MGPDWASHPPVIYPEEGRGATPALACRANESKGDYTNGYRVLQMNQCAGRIYGECLRKASYEDACDKRAGSARTAFTECVFGRRLRKMRGKCAGSARKVREGARFFMGKRDRNISLKSLPSRLDREAQKKTKKQLAQNKWEPWGRQEERVQGEGLKISGTRECYIAAMNTAVRAGALPGTRGFVRLQESVAAAGVAGETASDGPD